MFSATTLSYYIQSKNRKNIKILKKAIQNAIICFRAKVSWLFPIYVNVRIGFCLISKSIPIIGMIIWSSNLEDKTDDGVGNLLYVIISQSFFDVYGRRAHFNVVSIQLRKETPSSLRLPHFHSIVLIFAWNNAADKRHPETKEETAVLPTISLQIAKWIN